MDPKIAAKVLATAMQGESLTDHMHGQPSISQAIWRNGGDIEFRKKLVHVLMDISDNWESMPDQTARELNGSLPL